MAKKTTKATKRGMWLLCTAPGRYDFFFGDVNNLPSMTHVALDGEPAGFRSRKEAVAAAKRKGLTVLPSGKVETSVRVNPTRHNGAFTSKCLSCGEATAKKFPAICAACKREGVKVCEECGKLAQPGAKQDHYNDCSAGGPHKTLTYGQLPSQVTFSRHWDHYMKPGELFDIKVGGKDKFGLTGKYDENEMWILLNSLVSDMDEYPDDGTGEDPGSWASSILGTLGFEWI